LDDDWGIRKRKRKWKRHSASKYQR
jgi:hypothetical protein